LLVGLPAALLLFGVGAWLLYPRSAITRANAEKIREGMTLAEVEAILGGPPRDDSTGLLTGDNNPDGTGSTIWIWPAPMPNSPALEWVSDHVAVRVHFDDAGRAESVSRIPLCRAEEGLLDRFRRWLGL
jgi:hypothetical protein